MKVRIHIDRLVLDGFALTAGQGRQVQAAVEGELSRLVAASSQAKSGARDDAMANEVPSLPQRTMSVPTADAGAFDPAPDASPGQLGQHIARSAYWAIGRANE